MRNQEDRLRSVDDSLARLLDRLEDSHTAEDERVLVTVELFEPDDWFIEKLRLAESSAERDHLLLQRHDGVIAIITRYLDYVDSLSPEVEVVSFGSLLPVVDLVVSRSNLPRLALHPDFASINEVGSVELEQSDGFTRAIDLRTIAPYDGSTTSQGTPIVIGVIDGDGGSLTHAALNSTHHGFREGPVGTPSRVLGTYHCTDTSCTAGASHPSSGGHGTRVASITLGDLWLGQHPDITSPLARWQGSGIAPGARVRYYRVVYPNAPTSPQQIRRALERAVIDQVDIVNMSFSVVQSTFSCPDSTYCADWWNPASIRTAIELAHAAGIVLVAASGNCPGNASTAACTVKFPASHPNVIAVGAYDFSARHRADYSGGSDLFKSTGSTWFGSLHVFRQVYLDLMASGDVVGWYGPGGFVSTSDVVVGTSYSSPQVAGMAALTKQWLSGLNAALADIPWAVKILLLLMGDGHTDPSGIKTDQLDTGWGYGAPKFFYPDRVGSGGGWGIHEIFIKDSWPHNAHTLSIGPAGPMPSNVKGWKWAIAIDRNDSAELPFISYRVFDTCPPGGYPALIKQGVWHGNRGRIILDAPATQLVGRCLEMRIQVHHTRSAGDTLWMTDYYFTNSPENHLEMGL